MFYCTMQYSTLSLAIGLYALTLACKPADLIRPEPTIEDPAPVPSAVHMKDVSHSSQLISGFWELQGGSWRWTAPSFMVVLGTPPGAATNGAWLTLEFLLPDASINTLKNITVAAQIGGVELPPETITASGPRVFRREVPASVFKRDAIAVKFTVDKYLKPPDDSRDLALVVTSIALESK